jgi:uncharacterized DUF497 family protein
MKDDDFEWDDAKAAANLLKHGVSFEEASAAFGDAFAIEFADDREDYGEERLVLLGMFEDRLLAVVHTMREHTVRIISAREAEPHERRRYHEENR